MSKDGITCLYCQKTFKALPNHLRARHPEEYKLHVQFELQCIERRITQLESLAQGAPPPKPPKKTSVAGGLFTIETPTIQDPFYADRGVFLKEALNHLDKVPDSVFGARPLVRPQLKAYLDRELKRNRGNRAKIAPDGYDRDLIAALIAAYHSMATEARLRINGLQQEIDQKAAGGVPCPVCSQQFKNQGDATEHLRGAHPNTYLEQIETHERSKNIILNNPHASEAERARATHLVNHSVAYSRLWVLVDLGRYPEAIAQLRIGVWEYVLAYGGSLMTIQHLMENTHKTLSGHFKDCPMPPVLAEGFNSVEKELSEKVGSLKNGG